MKKYAILSMDIEDWYHLDYINKTNEEKKYSMLNGLEVYSEIIKNHNIKSSFFVLGEISNSIKHKLIYLNSEKHDIGSHGWNHKRPLAMNLNSFENDIVKTKNKIEDILGSSIQGYRAPCFSLNRKRLNIIKKVGYKYDSSLISFSNHPLYGEIELNDYDNISKNIFKKNNFLEFRVSTLKIFNKNIPISGGGYIRIFPWLLFKFLLKEYLKKNNIYVFYTHPFELSKNKSPILKNISYSNKFRFNYGRNTVYNKINHLIKFLKKENYNFITFSNLRELIINKNYN